MGRDQTQVLRIRELRTHPFRVLIREVTPVTPCGFSAKTAVGDHTSVGALLVADGHGLLTARLRWRRLQSGAHPHGGRHKDRHDEWRVESMEVDPWGRASGAIVADTAGDYEFQIQAWVDTFATWQRDLSARNEAGEDLEGEFAEGVGLLEEVLTDSSDVLSKKDRRKLKEAVTLLSSSECSLRNRLDTASDDGLRELVSRATPEARITTSPAFPLRVDRELAVRGAWYEFFPRSEGGFHEGAESYSLLESVADAGFDVVYLPPIHPIGDSQRKGRNNSTVAEPDDVGSPWAIGSAEGGHTSIDPALGDLEDFRRFVSRAGELGIEIALDFALQCSPDHPWVKSHPEWFIHRVDGSIRYAENPPKKYQDIYPVNFWPDSDSDRIALWEACRQILEYWISEGISVFRVDNPHTKPLAFWRWLIAVIQGSHPQVVFLSEAFTDPPMMHSLAEVGFSQSYTYFTWRHSKTELTEYGEELARGYASGWFRPNLWPNTPDILVGSLREGSLRVFAQRALLAATLAPSWGIYSGYELGENDPFPGRDEYHYSEKYELYRRDHHSDDSLLPFIAVLNRFRRDHPAMWRIGALHFHRTDNDDVLAYSYARRLTEGAVDRVLVVVNLAPDETREATVFADPGALLLDGGVDFRVTDALSGQGWTWSTNGNYVRLDPSERVGHLFSLSADADSLQW